MESSVRTPAGSSRAATRSTWSLRRSRLTPESARAALGSSRASARRTARITSTTTIRLDARRGQARTARRSASLCGSSRTSLRRADASKYASSDRVGAELVEDLLRGWAFDAYRRRQIEQVAGGRGRLADRDQVVEDVLVLRQRAEHGDRAPPFGHDEALSPLDAAQVAAQVLP